MRPKTLPTLRVQAMNDSRKVGGNNNPVVHDHARQCSMHHVPGLIAYANVLPDQTRIRIRQNLTCGVLDFGANVSFLRWVNAAQSSLAATQFKLPPNSEINTTVEKDGNGDKVAQSSAYRK